MKILAGIIIFFIFIFLCFELFGYIRIKLKRYIKRKKRNFKKTVPFFSKNEVIVEPLKMPDSINIARDRAQAIDLFLNGVISQKFIERPPKYKNAKIPDKVVYADSIPSISTRLEREKTDEGLLLLGRVRDALILIDNEHELKFFEKNEDTLLITLEKRNVKRADGFPQKVVIRAAYFPDQIYDELESLQYWLGISVEYIQSKVKTKFLSSLLEKKAKSRDKLLGKCSISSSSGLIGGAIVSQDNSVLQITCKHVVSNQCSSVEGLSSQDKSYHDISVLHPEKSCPNDGNGVSCLLFAHPDSKMCKVRKMEVAADFEYFKSVFEQGLIVRKKHPNANKICGIVDCRGTMLTIGKYTYEDFLYVKPFSTFRLTHWIYKLFGCPFSKPGHSGSWVFDDKGRWIGMVVAGRGENSIVLPSWAILDYLADIGLDLSKSSLILWS
jgi:hypothetical protein